MRRLERNRARGEEEESVFVTMTDMTISFLLIIMILLAFFATQINSDETVPISVYKSAYKTVRQERDGFRQERNELRINNQELRSKVADLEAQLVDVASALKAITAERNRLSDKLKQLSLENQDLRSTVATIKAELTRFRSKLDAVTVERDRLQSELHQLRNENNKLLARILVLEENLDQIKLENKELRSLNNQLDKEIERLQEQIARLQEVTPLEAYLSQAIDQRREILVELRNRLLIEFPDLKVVISPEQDALRFQGEGLFGSGSSELQLRQRGIVETMGRLLDEILVCFTLGERAQRGPDCDSGDALIEAVQIEGHTDSDGSDLINLHLSTDRANETLLVMLDENQTILSHQNLRGQPVMSVSGYGEMRPIETNETTEGKAANRRIDLRIIMYAPSTVEEVEKVGRQLNTLRAAGGSE